MMTGLTTTAVVFPKSCKVMMWAWPRVDEGQLASKQRRETRGDTAKVHSHPADYLRV